MYLLLLEHLISIGNVVLFRDFFCALWIVEWPLWSDLTCYRLLVSVIPPQPHTDFTPTTVLYCPVLYFTHVLMLFPVILHVWGIQRNIVRSFMIHMWKWVLHGK